MRDEGLAELNLILSKKFGVIVKLLEKLSAGIELVEDLLLLALQSLALLEDSFIVVDLLEPRVLPYACKDLTLVVGNVIYQESGEAIRVVELL